MCPTNTSTRFSGHERMIAALHDYSWPSVASVRVLNSIDPSPLNVLSLSLGVISIGTTPALVTVSVGGQHSSAQDLNHQRLLQAIEYHLEGRLVGPWVEELRPYLAMKLSLRKRHSRWIFREFDSPITTDIGLLQELSQHQVSQLNCSQFLIQQMKELTR